MEQTNVYIYVGIVAIVVVGFGIFLCRQFTKNKHQRHIEKTLESLQLKYIKDIVLPDGVDGLAFIDYLLLIPNGVVVLDIHYNKGHLFGGESIDLWSQVVNQRTYKFANPLYANQHKCQAVSWNVKPLIKNNENWTAFGRIVFSNAGNFPKGIPEHVSMIDDLHSDLEKLTDMTQPVSDSARDLWDKLHDLSRSTKTHNTH